MTKSTVEEHETRGPTPKVFHDLTNAPTPLPDVAQEEWWLDAGSLLSRLLQVGQYTPKQQEEHLCFFRQHFLHHFGPYPPTWNSVLTRSGLPLEYSLNFQQNRDPVVRISFEPVSHFAGTSADPFNKGPSEEMVDRVAKLKLKNFDRTLFDHFATETFITDNEVERISDLDKYPVKTHTALAFDLNGDDICVKGYVHVRWKSMSSGTPIRDLIQTSFAKIKAKMNCAAAVDLVDAYMAESFSYNQYNFLAWDLTPLHQSRLKLYGAHNEVSLRKIEEVWTLGGLLTDQIATEGLELIYRLWELLGLDSTTRQYGNGYDDYMNQGVDDRLSPLIWNYEMRAGSTRPSPKIYFPVHGENDLKVATAISHFLASLGPKFDGVDYVECLASLYPHLDISRTSRLQAWISYSYTEKGVYMSVYYHSTSSYPLPGCVH
ncbi:aromatic prenyltransferase [Aspergillus taichungensis]|uniref:Aromatic prenyltransferase n=1 Tax=Aspergillus taichungensis TaxID=482145 RepID=A0A2J5I699_9EURO|nr:aromatic prenyltransferase [Aspergillus taichungensis]